MTRGIVSVRAVEETMATHMLDYNSVHGRWTACGRYYKSGERMPRGVRIVEGDADVSCQSCLGTERLKLARTRRHTSEGTHTPVICR